jgi:Arc/MetJ-type ribon-helix-helix transcriptional regulator
MGPFASRSAVIQAAIRLMRDRRYTDSYASAWSEWETGDEVDWDAVTSDGMD